MTSNQNEEKPPEVASFEIDCIDKFTERYEDIDTTSFYFKSYFGVMFEFIIILLFTWLGFDTGISEAFIEGDAFMYAAGFTTFFISCLTVGAIAFVIQIPSNSLLSFIFYFVYCLLITFYMNCISAFTKKINIICGLIMVILDLIGLQIYVIIFNTYNLVVFGLAQVIMTAITTPIIIIYFIEDSSTIPRLIAINLAVIIYFEIVIYLINRYNDKNSDNNNNIIINNYLAIFAFDFLFFVPVAVLFFIALMIYGGLNS